MTTKHGAHKRTFRPDPQQAMAIAQSVATTRKTCEGCAGLRTWPRPMCKQPSSQHFRTVRDTYHERCASYSVQGKTAEPGAQPEPPRAMNNLQVVVRGRGV